VVGVWASGSIIVWFVPPAIVWRFRKVRGLCTDERLGRVRGRAQYWVLAGSYLRVWPVREAGGVSALRQLGSPRVVHDRGVLGCGIRANMPGQGVGGGGCWVVRGRCLSYRLGGLSRSM